MNFYNSDKNNKYTFNLIEEDDNLNISEKTIIDFITNSYSKLIHLNYLCENNNFKKLCFDNLKDFQIYYY